MQAPRPDQAPCQNPHATLGHPPASTANPNPPQTPPATAQPPTTPQRKIVAYLVQGISIHTNTHIHEAHFLVQDHAACALSYTYAHIGVVRWGWVPSLNQVYDTQIMQPNKTRPSVFFCFAGLFYPNLSGQTKVVIALGC